jgi:hypothetical protein
VSRLVFAWSVGGVILLCGSAAARLGARGAAAWADAGPVQRAAAVAWLAWMLATAAWPGFHRQFAPRVAVRAARLAAEAPSAWGVVGPLVAMGFLRATRRRRAVALGLVAGVVGMSALFARLPEPWRGLLDLGVAGALASGVGSLTWFAVRVARGLPPPIADDWA